MQLPDKKEYLKRLREDPVYQSTLSKASTDSEKRMIKAYTEDFYMKFYDGVFGPLRELLEKDPDALNKAVSEIRESLIKSGSIPQESE